MITEFKIFENKIFGFKSIDYIDSFADLFSVISRMRTLNMIDGDGKLLVDIYSIGHSIPAFDDLFEDEEEYYEALNVVKDILDKYYKKI